MANHLDQEGEQKEVNSMKRESQQSDHDDNVSKSNMIEESFCATEDRRFLSSVMDMQSNASSSRSGSSKPGGYSGDESSDISDDGETSSDPSSSSNSKIHEHRNQNDISKTNEGNEDQNSFSVQRSQSLGRHLDGDGNISIHQKNINHSKGACHASSDTKSVVLVNPIDPNIDLSCLDIVSAKEHEDQKDQQRKENSSLGSTEKASSDVNADTIETYVDAYSKLLESCQPFFNIFQDEASFTDHKISDDPTKNKELGDNDSVSSMIVLAPRPKNRKQKESKSLEPKLGPELICHGSISQIPSSEAKSSSQHSSQGGSEASSSSQNRELFRLLERGTSALQNRLRDHDSNLNRQRHSSPPLNREESNSSSSQRPGLVSESSAINSGSAAGTASASGSGNENAKQEENISTEMTTSGENNSVSDGLIKKRSDESLKHKSHKHSRSSELKAHYSQNDSSKPASCHQQERLAAKKRKRMDQRKEFEDMVRNQLQSSSENSVESIFQPGDYVSMEDSLSFTRTARLIVQADPPYLAVHINAAFSRLTGIQNSTAIGKPISKILTIVSTHNESASTVDQKDGKHLNTSFYEHHESKHSEKESTNDSNDPIQGMEIEGSSFPDGGANNSSCDFQHDRSHIESVITSSGFKQYYKVQTLDIRRETAATSDASNSNYNSVNSSISSKDENVPRSCVMSVCAIHPHSNYHHTISGAKRSKSFQDQAKCMIPTHFLIQLFPIENERLIPESISQPLEQSSVSSSRLEDDSQISSGSTRSKPVVACG